MTECGFSCFDCGVDTHNEYYMVRDHIWESVVDGDGMLCIGCLERRLGRILTRSDFTNAPVNDIEYGMKSRRLIMRLQPTRSGHDWRVGDEYVRRLYSDSYSDLFGGYVWDAKIVVREVRSNYVVFDLLADQVRTWKADLGGKGLNGKAYVVGRLDKGEEEDCC